MDEFAEVFEDFVMWAEEYGVDPSTPHLFVAFTAGRNVGSGM